jgi:glutaconate CoA-transferase subunit B
VPLPEVFSYLLQAGRVDVGFLGAAQIDRFGNLNSTVIGSYDKPRTRLPGAGGAPEIASHAQQIFVVMRASPRSFVEKIDFCTSAGFMTGGDARAKTSAHGKGPQAVITDFGVLTPAAGSNELTLTALFPGANLEGASKAVGWTLRVADTIEALAPPTAEELSVLRALNARTEAAHSRGVDLPA